MSDEFDLDERHIEQLEALNVSGGWHLVTERLSDIEYASARKLRRRDLDERETAFVRGYLEAIEWCQQAPLNIIEDIREELNKQSRVSNKR